MTRLFSLTIATLLTSLTVSACDLGEVGGGTGTPDAAPGMDSAMGDGGGGGGGQSFNAMIKPLVTGCVGCHSGVTPPNLSAFNVLDAKYKMKPGTTNVLVIKGDATAGVHQGAPYFDAAKKATVAAWIDSL